VDHGSAAEEIVTKTEGTGLIVISTHGSTGLERLGVGLSRGKGREAGGLPGAHRAAKRKRSLTPLLVDRVHGYG
jgi:hypothetical protein